MRAIARIRCAAADQAGVTLVELLVVMVMAVVVFGVILTFAESGQRVAKNDRERTQAVLDVQSGLYRMTHELRQGYAPASNCTQPCSGMAPSLTNSLDVVVVPAVSTGAASYRVRYDCSITSPTSPTGSSYRECCRYSSTTLTASPSNTGTLSASEPCGSGTRVIDRVTGPASVFQPPTGASTPTSYTAEVQVPEKGEYTAGHYSGSIDLSDGIYLRNIAGDV